VKNTAGHIASIIRRTNAPVAALADRDEREFIAKLLPKKDFVAGIEVEIHASIELKGEETIVNFPDGTPRIYKGTSTQKYLVGIAKEHGIMIIS
jgi:hypothetical protein